ARLARSLEDAHRKWSTGIYAAWYPRKDAQAARAFVTQIKRSRIAKILRVELDLGGGAARPARTRPGIVNPPQRLEQELAVLLPARADGLAQTERPQVRIEQLAAVS